MSQLARLLGVDARQFDGIVSALEISVGHPAIDSRLIGDLHEATARAIKALGLDPKNTTGPELYRALGNRFASDFAQLIKSTKFDDRSLQALVKRGDLPPFWQGSLWAGVMYGTTPLSFNVFDVFASFKANSAYGARKLINFRQALANELLRRYKTYASSRDILLDKLERVIIKSENKSKKENKK